MLQWWRVADGREVGDQMGMRLEPFPSRDGNWIECGSGQGASVWDAKTQVKSIEVKAQASRLGPVHRTTNLR